MANIPFEVQPSVPQAVASYSFTDLTSKTGYITFYVLGTSDDSITLTPQIIASDADNYETTDSYTSGTSDMLRNELDIDFDFNTVQTLKGNLYVTLSYWIDGGNGVSSGDVYTKVRIYHYDGSTETEIGAQQTTTTISRGTSGRTYTRETVVFDIARKTFVPGDSLRLNIEHWGGLGTNTSSGIFHDGKNRDISGTTFLGEAVPTNIILLAPFEVEV